MIEQFAVQEADIVRITPDALQETITAILEKLDVPPEDARLGADVLVAADLRGMDGHGVSYMLSSYVPGFTSGHINLRPDWKIIRESPATATVDSDRGLGVIIAPKAMEIAIAKARATGIGVVTIKRGRHLGMAGYHAMLALKHDMIGVCMTAPRPFVLPTFGREPRLGTNPIAFAAPAGQEPPFVLDMATSTVPVNKVRLARRLGLPLPPGWLADEEGEPIMEPGGPIASERLLPLGGTPEMGSHKGYGLACMVEVLCAVLSGAGFGMLNGSDDYPHFVAAFNVAAFTDVEQFKETMDQFLRTLKSTPPVPGHDRVLVAGQPEDEVEAERRAIGIPLHLDLARQLWEVCGKLSVPSPFEKPRSS